MESIVNQGNYIYNDFLEVLMDARFFPTFYCALSTHN